MILSLLTKVKVFEFLKYYGYVEIRVKFGWEIVLWSIIRTLRVWPVLHLSNQEGTRAVQSMSKAIRIDLYPKL